MLASSHKQEEGSSLIPKMELTITQQQQLVNISSKCGDRMKNWVPIVPWFLPPLLTYKESQASKHTNNRETPQIYYFSKKHEKKGGKENQENSIEHKQIRRRRRRKTRKERSWEKEEMRDTHFHLCKKLKTPSPGWWEGIKLGVVKWCSLWLCCPSSYCCCSPFWVRICPMTCFCCFDQAKQ